MRRDRKTKIVATLGPASSSQEMIEALFKAGVDVFRLNFSHGSHDDHRARYDLIRSMEEKFHTPTCVLADLQGPKLRVGTFVNGSVELVTGAKIKMDQDPTPGDSTRIPMMHPEIFQALTPGSNLLLDDGKIRLEVVSCDGKKAEVSVVIGGKLSDKKGVNVPDVALPIPALTEKDRKDLDFALSIGVDAVALSFVQRPEDVIEAKEIVKDRAIIISKIEKPQAVELLDEIVEISDGIMVARGDLAVEMPLEDVPVVQKHLVNLCKSAGKPVIVATQMMESMIEAPTPTRAEVSDIARAVYEGADCVMLSAESASGKFPIDSVSIMDRVIKRVEEHEYFSYEDVPLDFSALNEDSVDALTVALQKASYVLGASAVVIGTRSFYAMTRLSQKRIMSDTLVMTNDIGLARKGRLLWGVYAKSPCKDGKCGVNYVENAKMFCKYENVEDGPVIVSCITESEIKIVDFCK